MTEQIVPTGQTGDSGGSSVIYWVLGAAVLSGAGFAAWYYLIRKKDDASSSIIESLKITGSKISVEL